MNEITNSRASVINRLVRLIKKNRFLVYMDWVIQEKQQSNTWLSGDTVYWKDDFLFSVNPETEPTATPENDLDAFA